MAKIARVSKHLGQRYTCANAAHAITFVLRLDLGSTPRQIANDVSHAVDWRHHFDVHHRFNHDGVGPSGSIVERHRAGDLKRHFGRIAVMVAAVVDHHADAAVRAPTA